MQQDNPRISALLIAILLSACGGVLLAPPQKSRLVTALHDVQGSGRTSPMNGRNVRVRGIVTGDFQNGDADAQSDLGGFYLQEEHPDADPATSDAVFIYDGPSPAADVNVGDKVGVDGIVKEHFGETQIVPTHVEVMSTGAASVTETIINLPARATILNSDDQRIADLERYEGMLVRFAQTLTVTDLFNIERYGEVLLSQDGRLVQYTNANAPDIAGFEAHLEEIAARSIMLDDGSSILNADRIRYLYHFVAAPGPHRTLRVGDTVADLTGNLRFSRGSGGSGKETFRLVPTGEPRWTTANPRPTTAPKFGGTLNVASFNVTNYFTTIDSGRRACGPSGNERCRGANSREEFDRQRAKIVSAMVLLDADIIVLTELENNSTASLQSIVEGVNANSGTGVYSYVDTGTIGSDAIRVGIIFKPGTVSERGGYVVIDSDVDPRFDDSRNRPSVAQAFTQNSNGAVITIVANHLKSKGSDCASVGDPDRNDGQRNCNITRRDAATALAKWLETDPTGSGDPDILIIGDLNAYMQEDPVATLEAAGYDNLLKSAVGTGGYSFVFEGQAGALDHALASPSLVGQVTGVSEWHINADEAPVHDYNLEYGRDPDIFDATLPYRASDHDPIVVGLDLTN
jgi:predicted extracellular nuclease